MRAATPSDLQALVTLESVVFGDQAWSSQSVRAELAQLGGSRSILVADVMGDLVGYVVVMVIAGAADLTRIAVAPDHRRNGLGRALVDEALDEAASRGCDHVMLEVAADNVPAINLYVAMGFHEVARRDRYYAGAVDAVVMRRPLVVVAGEVRGVESDG